MTFKLPDNQPSKRSSYEEWADYAEYLALTSGKLQLTNLFKTTSLISDELEINGADDESDELIAKGEEIASEIERRKRVTNNRYPFSVEDKGYSIAYNKDDSQNDWVYKFLLLSTRLDMSKNKIQNGIDGTQVFEKLSAEAVKDYFGHKSQSLVFGTSVNGGFKAKLQHFIKAVGEGGLSKENSTARPQDDKLDIVVWSDFTDKKSSKFIGFGQCKTGTSWQDSLSDLQPDVFCATWFTNRPVLIPIRLFFCSLYFPDEIWEHKGYSAGLIFDRFRIMDSLPAKLEQSMLDEIKTWCSGVIK